MVNDVRGSVVQGTDLGTISIKLLRALQCDFAL